MSDNDGITNPGATTQLQEMIAEAYSNSKDHGFHDGEDKIPEEYIRLAKHDLMHTEIAEATECVRDGEVKTMYEYQVHGTPTRISEPYEPYEKEFGLGKPLGLLSEYADVLIRVFDEIGRLNRAEEFEKVLVAKMQYNRSRPHKHGRKC